MNELNKMKTIDKKKLYDLFVSYDEWFYKSTGEKNYLALWERTYSMARDIGKNINNYSTDELYSIIFDSKCLNENVTFEQIVSLLEAIGFEVK